MSEESGDAEQLKAEGNSHFKNKDFPTAIVFYTRALKTMGAGSDDQKLKTTILTNRAACHLQSKEFEKCVDDCKAALKEDSTAVKALYRRAQAYEKLQKFPLAFKDTRRLLSLDPKNKPGIQLATRLRDSISKEALGVSKAISDALDTSVSTKARKDATLLIAARASDPPFASEFVISDGVGQLWAAKKVDDAYSVLRVMTQLVKHKHLAATVSKQIDLKEIVALVTGALEAKASKQPGDSSATETARAAIAFLARTTTKLQVAASGSVNAAADATSPSASLATAVAGTSQDVQRVRAAALQACVAAMRLRAAVNAEVQKFDKAQRELHQSAARLQCAALDAAVQIVVTPQATAEFTQLGGLYAAFELGCTRDRDVCSRLTLMHCRLLQGFGTEEAVKAQVGLLVQENLQSPDRDAQLKAGVVLASLFMVYPSVGVHVLSEGPGMARLCAMAQCGVPWIQSLAVDVMAQAAATDEGRKLFFGAVLETLQLLLGSPSPAVVAGAASVVAKMTLSAKAFDAESPDGQRLLQAALGTLHQKKQKKRGKGSLCDDDEQHPGAKGMEERGVETLTALIRNNEVKDEIAHGPAMKALCALAADVAAANDAQKQMDYEIEMELTQFKKQAKAAKKMSKSKDGDEGGDDDDDEENDQGDDPLSMIASKSTLAYGLAFVFAQMTVTERELKAISLRDQELNVDEYEELQKLQDMHLVRQRQEQGLPEPTEDSDTDARCSARCLQFVQSGGVTALVQLAHENASPRVRDLVGQVLCHVSREQSARGQVVQLGGLRVLLKLIARDSREFNRKQGDDDDEMGKAQMGQAPQVAEVEKQKAGLLQKLRPRTKKEKEAQERKKAGGEQITAQGVEDCSQAVARLLISTNPHLLSDQARRDSVAALLALTDCNAQLLQFEACMALTNLAVVSPELRRYMSSKGVPRALIYLMFSEHDQVQRAAAEAMCNLLPDPSCARRVLENENPGVKLWVALSEVWDDEDTLKTAEAACAGLISIAGMYGQIDEGEPLLGEDTGPYKLLQANVATALVDILKNSRHPSMEHRAAVCMQFLCEIGEEEGETGSKLRESFIKAGAMKVVQRLLNPPAVKKGKKGKGTKGKKGKGKKDQGEVEELDVSTDQSAEVVVEDADENVEQDAAEEEEGEQKPQRPRLPVSAPVKEALQAVMEVLREQKHKSSRTKSQGGDADGLDYSRFEFMEDDDGDDDDENEEEEEKKTREDLERDEQMSVLMEKLQERLSEEEQQRIVDEPSQEEKLRLVQKAISEHPEVQEEVRRELITRRVARAKKEQERN